MKKRDSSTKFELFRCDHIVADRHEAGSRQKVASETGEVIFVGIGSSLSLEDTPALHLVSNLARMHKNVCAVNLEHSFWLLPDIVRTHKSIYIVDSFVSEGPIGNILILPLNDDIFDRKKLEEENGFQFGSTHSISWFDELKLARLEATLKGPVTFIGIESNIAFELERTRNLHFDHALEAVEAVLSSDLVELTPKSVLPMATGSSLSG